MTIADICQKLNISNTTLKNYIDTFDEFFSAGAKERKRQFEESDLNALATIAALSSQGLNYGAIREKLSGGYRLDFEGVTLGVDNRVIPVSTAQATIEASQASIELGLVKAERDKLLTRLETAEGEHKAETKALQDEIRLLLERIATLQAKLAAAEARLEEREKRRRWF